MWKTRKHYLAALMGTLLGFAGAGGCDMTGLSSLNTLLDTLNSWESSDYGSYNGSNYWSPSSPGWDLLDIKSG